MKIKALTHIGMKIEKDITEGSVFKVEEVAFKNVICTNPDDTTESISIPIAYMPFFEIIK